MKPSQIKTYLLLCLLFSTFASFSQTGGTYIKGRVLNKNNQKLPFASLQYKGSALGAITNEDGEFVIPLSSHNPDTLVVYYMGYQSKEVYVNASTSPLTITLEEAVNYLSGIEVVGNKIPDAYTLLKKLVKKYRTKSDEQVSKAFLSLYSSNDQPLEIFEAFYNALISRRAGVQKLKLKNGRAGIIANNDFAFVSLNTTDILTDFSPFVKNPNQKLPLSPTNLGFSTLKILYNLQLRQVIDYETGPVAVIAFWPKVSNGMYFSGTIYFDIQHNKLYKLTLDLRNTQKEFLKSIQDSVKVDSLDINLQFNYNPNSSNLQSIIFDYSFMLSSNPQNLIQSKTLLAFYDYGVPFSMPVSSPVQLPYDYQRILSYPYNDIFWTQNYYIPKSKNRIDFTNYFKTNGYLINHDSLTRQSRYIQSPFINWSKNLRLAWGDIPVQRPKNISKMDGGQITIHYQSASPDYLKGHLFLDYETVGDTTYYYSRASIDRSMSFLSKMPRNVFTLLYLNIFFDLHEIHRRRLIQKLNTLQFVNRHQIEKTYLETIQNLNHDLYKLKKENKKKCNAETLKNMNIIIEKELGINNFAVFGINSKSPNQD